MKTLHAIPLAVCLLLPLAAQATDSKPTGIAAEIRSELVDARKEVRAELAKAKRDLETDNLRIDNSLQFGDSGRKQKALPRAEITPQGDFLLETDINGMRFRVLAEVFEFLLQFKDRLLEVELMFHAAGILEQAKQEATGNSANPPNPHPAFALHQRQRKEHGIGPVHPQDANRLERQPERKAPPG